MAVMRRVLLYDHMLGFAGELSPADVLALKRVEEINGEDSLTISTTAHLGKGDRVLLQDDALVWHEYIVDAPDELHEQGAPVGTYECESSLIELQGDYVEDKRPGVQTPVAAGVALEAALSGSSWGVGTVSVGTTGGASLYHVSAWDAVKKVVEVWGGEIRADIQVDPFKGVVSRKLSLLQRRGSTEVGRRFDYGADLTSVRRKVASGMVPTALYAWGKGEETDSGGDGRKIGIAEVNGGVPYVVASDDIVKAFARPDGKGGYRHNFATYENSDQSDPSKLLAEAKEAVKVTCAPTVTYEATVAQFAEAGTDMLGVGLGDTVQVVDRKFLDGGLRVEARVVGIEHDDLARMQTKVTLGSFGDTLAGYLKGLDDAASKIEAMIPSLDDPLNLTSQYIERLIGRLNEAINATGGYSYIRPGEGIKVYDKAEDESPTKVIELKGGSLRIADSKKSDGTWDWKTVMTASDGLVASAVTAANIVSGWIGSPSGNYWNLDTGELRMAASTTIGGKTVEEIVKENAGDVELSQESVFNALTNNGQTQGIYLQNGLLYLNGTYLKTGQIDADLLTGGTIRARNGAFSLDLDTGTVSVPGINEITPDGTIAGENAQDIADLLTYFRFRSDGLTIQGSSSSFKTLYGSSGLSILDDSFGKVITFGANSYGGYLEGQADAFGIQLNGTTTRLQINGSDDSIEFNADYGRALQRTGATGFTGTGYYHALYNLWSNSSGTYGSLQLSYSAQYFRHLIFCCEDNINARFTVWIKADSSYLSAELSTAYVLRSNGIHVESRTINVSGTSVTDASDASGWFSMGIGGTGPQVNSGHSSIKITAVYGVQI